MSEQTATPKPKSAIRDPKSEIRNPKSEIRDPKSEIRNPNLTVEAGLYAAILAVGLVVRWYRLGEAPLSPNEAQLALAALRGTAPPAGASPLLYCLNSILFAILGSGDGLARIVPALCGSALVVMPALLRERLGRVGALGAAAILAISPVAIVTSRTLGGEAIVAVVMLGLVAVADGYLSPTGGRASWLYAGAAMLGLGLASGHGIYSALLTLLVMGFVAASGQAGAARQKWEVIRNTPGLVGRWIGVMAAVLAASATALMWRPGGLAAAIDLLSTWLSGFSAGVTEWHWPIQVLIVYEPFALIVGLGGLFLGLSRASLLPSPRRQFIGFLSTWLAMATLLAIIRPGRTNGDMLLVVIPLAMLGGYAFEALADSLRATRFGAEEGLFILILLTVVAYFVLGLAGYVHDPNAAQLPSGVPNLGLATQVIQMFLAVALMAILISLFGALITTEAAARSGMIAVALALAMMTWSAGWGAAQNHPGDPRELIAGPETTSPAVRDLARELAMLSAQMTSDPTTLSFVVQSPPDSVTGWYLRGMPNASFVTALDAASVPQVIVTTGKPPTLSGDFAGQRFILRHEWRIEGQSANDVLKWLLYRRAEPPKPTWQVTLWVRQGK